MNKKKLLTARRDSQDARVTALRLKLFGKVSFIIAQLKLESCRYNQDPPRTCKGMDETSKDEMCKEKIEDLANELSNNERTSHANNLQNDEDDEKAKRGEIILNSDFCAYQLTRTISSSDCHDSKETSLKLSNLNLSKSIFFFYNFYVWP